MAQKLLANYPKYLKFVAAKFPTKWMQGHPPATDVERAQSIIWYLQDGGIISDDTPPDEALAIVQFHLLDTAREGDISEEVAEFYIGNFAKWLEEQQTMTASTQQETRRVADDTPTLNPLTKYIPYFGPRKEAQKEFSELRDSFNQFLFVLKSRVHGIATSSFDPRKEAVTVREIVEEMGNTVLSRLDEVEKKLWKNYNPRT